MKIRGKVSECYVYPNADGSIEIFLKFEGDEKEYTIGADYGGSLFLQESSLFPVKSEPLSKEMLEEGNNF